MTFSHLFALSLSLSLSLSPVICLPVTVVSFHTLSPVRLDCLRTMSSASNLFWSLMVGADGVIHFSLIKCHRLGCSSERSLSRSCIQSIFLSFKDSYVESPTVTVYQLLALYSVHSSAAVLQCCIEFSGLIHTRMSP